MSAKVESTENNVEENDDGIDDCVDRCWVIRGRIGRMHTSALIES